MDIKEIADKAGGVVALSKALGLSRGAVSQWQAVPSDRVLAVCSLAGWRVTPHQIRPDLYPNPSDALPFDQPTPTEQAPDMAFVEVAEPRDGDGRQDCHRHDDSEKVA